MKKVLITGAAGSIGLCLIKYLLSEGKYEITALDLKNEKVYKRLKKYRKRINIVYGDILDYKLIENLVKDTDIIIHLATCLPPFAELKSGISEIIEYNGIESIIKAINYYNPKCELIYASTTSLYSDKDSNVDTKIKVDSSDYYNDAKFKAENILKKKLQNYVIVRVPLLLTDLRSDSFIYNVKGNNKVEVISKEDAAYAFCKIIDVYKKLNKKIINIGGGESCRIEYKELINKIMKTHGITFSFIVNKLFVPSNFNSPYLLDSDKSNEILNYRNDSIDSYLLKQKRRSKNRIFSKFIAKIFFK